MDTKLLRLKQKENALIASILTQRKEAAKKISSKLHDILYNNFQKKEKIIIQRIIIARKNNSIKIQSYFRGYIIRKKIQYYISKSSTCYLIETGFTQNFKNLQVVVLFHKKNKVYDLCHDKFFNKYIFFINRALINKDTYKVQFINEGRIIIDSNHEAFEENGIYYNRIDFQKIRKNEEQNIRNNKNIVKSAIIFMKEKNLSIIPNKKISELNCTIEDEKNENLEYGSKESMDLSKCGGSTRIETPIKKLKNSVNLNSASGFKKKKSCKLKGILKQRSSFDRKLSKHNSLKVKFGNIEISS